jgi:zinc/manganese transport system permease protein
MSAAFALPFFRTALIASLVLAGIHAYLGFHIVRRGVIFVDLALAQMAALGVALALVLNVHENEHLTYALALGMTFVGATVFAWLRGQEQRNVPLEAFIGIVFATAQAAVFLVLEKSPSGPEHLKETLAGTLFTVAPAHVRDTAVLYAVIGVAHFLLRRPFFEITNDPRGAEARGRKLFWWDLAFYAMFGLVVTSSVQIAGVLLVFGFLVIPAVAGLLATERPGLALVVGWVFGFAGSLAGLWGSIRFDLPAAPSILVSLTLLLFVLGTAVALWKRSRETAWRTSAGAGRSGERPRAVADDGIPAARGVPGIAEVEDARR